VPALPRTPGVLRLGPRSFAPHELVVMAIVNRTPDSFYDRGASYAEGAAHDAVDRAVADGAAIIDIGGVKAGPGDEVDVAEELRRTAGFVAAVRDRHPGTVISVDTWRAEVGAVVVGEGADLLNDTWGGVDPALAEVAAAAGAGLVCAHAGGLAPRTRPHRVAYDPATGGVVADVLRTVTRLAERAVALGVRPDELVATGWPVLVALSRKDWIGEALDLPPDERLEGTLAATALCAWLGGRVFRAHDIAATRRVLDLVAVVRGHRDLSVARRGLA